MLSIYVPRSDKIRKQRRFEGNKEKNEDNGDFIGEKKEISHQGTERKI